MKRSVCLPGGFDSWRLEQSEESEQDLMDKFGLRKREGPPRLRALNVTAACRGFTTAAINGSYITSLNQIGAISLKKFPICRRSWAEGGREGGKQRKRKKEGENRLILGKRLIKQREKRRVRGWIWGKRSARVTARTQATGRAVCLATISQSQERLRWCFGELLVLSH